jgi:hypothetical protein
MANVYYVIRSTFERPDGEDQYYYWNNDLGWASRPSATRFTLEERINFKFLPLNATWDESMKPETKYRYLKQGAKFACRNRGHNMTNFERVNSIVTINNPDRIIGRSECINCGRVVYVDTKPAMNGIDIAGNAVALNCDSTDKDVKY